MGVLTILIILYIIQILTVFLAFVSHDLDTKKELGLNIIPFYWVKPLFNYMNDCWKRLK